MSLSFLTSVITPTADGLLPFGHQAICSLKEVFLDDCIIDKLPGFTLSS